MEAYRIYQSIDQRERDVMSLNVVTKAVDHTSSVGFLQVIVYVNWRLNHRGSDFNVYANEGYRPNEQQDAALLTSLMSHLFTDDSGVFKIHVEPFSMTITASPAASLDDIIERIKRACGEIDTDYSHTTI